MNYCRQSLFPGLFILLASLVLLSLPFPARSAEHMHGTAANTDHLQHDGAPVKPSAQGQHQHPTSATDSTKVGLDEQLGTHLPLDLTFRDETGATVRLGDLINKPTVIAPVYYHCPNVCHFLQGELARVLPELNLVAGSDYQMLSVSFDETETPELAARSRDTYLAAADGKIPRQGWRFLTGDLDQIMALTGAAGYRFQRVGTDFQHPVAIMVVSADGTIVRYLHGTHILPKDLALALSEAKSGVVGTTIRKMVQYCFSYDPTQKTYIFNVLRVTATVILATLAAFFVFLLLTGKKRPKDRS